MKNETPKLDAKSLKKGSTRREFLKDSAAALGVGALAGLVGGQATYTVLDGYAMDLVAVAEKEVNRTIVDVQEFSGVLENHLNLQKKKIEESYSKEVLTIYEKTGIATPEEVAETERGLEAIIKGVEDIEEHYTIVENFKIMRDRVDKRLMSLDEKLESMSPSALKKVNDAIRKYFGKPYGEEGIEHRKGLRQRLESLCEVYNTNSDNRKAQIKVLEKLNEYLGKSELTGEERELYKFMKEKYSEQEKCEDLRDFIYEYQGNGENAAVLMRLRETLSHFDEYFEAIKQNKDYALELQGFLKQGIELKKDLREKSGKEIRDYKKDIDKQVSDLKEGVYGFINRLKKQGYGIETRDNLINRTPITNAVREKGAKGLHVICRAAAATVAALGTYFTWEKLGKSRKVRARDNALNEAVDQYNILAEKYNKLRDNNTQE